MSTEKSPLALEIGNPLKALNRFFHSEEIPYGMALVRIVFPWAIIAAHVRRWPYAREIFSLDGATAPLWHNYQTFSNIPEFSGNTMVAAHTAMLLFLVTASIGWFTRLSLVGAAVVFAYTNMADSVGTLAKFTCIGTHTMLILAMSRCADVWSVDAWVKGYSKKKVPWPGEPTADWPRSSMWARRLLMISLASVYFGAGITKLKTPGFFGSDQLISWMLADSNFDNPLGEWFAMNPVLLIVSAYVTVVWEILFPFLIWRGWGKLFMVTIGLMFHLFTLLMLGLTIFPAVCAAMYFMFLDEHDYQVLFSFARKVRRRNASFWNSVASGLARVPRPSWPESLRMPSPVAFGIFTTCGVAAGMAAEHFYDPYGIRRPEGPYTLKELSPEYVARLTRPAPPLQVKDVFFNFEIGKLTAGGLVINRSDEYRPGDSMHAHFFAPPPHEDMWVECNLHDSEDRVVDRVPLILSQDATRGTFHFKITEALLPGDYYVVLRNGATEISRRKVKFLPADRESAKSPIAN